MGYGSRALDLLSSYYEGRLTSLDEASSKAATAEQNENDHDDDDDANLLTEEIAPRKNLPPLLQQLGERPPEALHYIGTSFGVTLPLFKFWNRAAYRPLYLRQTAVRHDAVGRRSSTSSDLVLVAVHSRTRSPESTAASCCAL